MHVCLCVCVGFRVLVCVYVCFGCIVCVCGWGVAGFRRFCTHDRVLFPVLVCVIVVCSWLCLGLLLCLVVSGRVFVSLCQGVLFS